MRAAALPQPREAVRGWRALEAPYETARSRELVGRALRAMGDEESAGPELAATATFAEIGAVADLRPAGGRTPEG